jgi:1-acyl-sn-glycerol-3-phosphate acyltransferase
MMDTNHDAWGANIEHETPAPQPAAYLTGVRYIPRWIGGITCYIAFGLGGLLSSITLLPLLRFWPGSQQQKISRVQKTVSLMFKLFVQMLTLAGVIKLNGKNVNALRDAKGVIVVANHPCLVDVVILISLMPNAGCIVKQGLWRNPFLRGVVSCAGYIPNRGAELMLQDCQQVLDKQSNLIIFPEGTRTLTSNIINPFARGAANIALRTQTNILPVVLHTDVAGLTKQQPWYEIPRQTMNMTVNVLQPLSSHGTDATQNSVKKSARQLTRDLEQLYVDTLKPSCSSHR